MSAQHAARFQSELIAAILLKILEDSGDRELIAEAFRAKPDVQKLGDHLVRLNEAKHAQLLRGSAPVPQPAPAAPQGKRASFRQANRDVMKLMDTYHADGTER